MKNEEMKNDKIMKKIFTLTLLLFAVMSAMADTQQNWWGYVSNDTEKGGVGTETAETYDCAIFIPGNHAIAAGKTIKAVRFGLTAPSGSNAKVWLASSLPSGTVSTSNTLQLVNVSAKELGSDNIEVDLTTPYAIPAEGVYVGYSFNIKTASSTADQYPVLTTGNDAPNTLLLKTSSSMTSWGDFNGYGFGGLFLQVLLEGEFADNTATAADFGPVYAMIGQTATAQIAVTNAGGTPLTSIDYTITTDGEASTEQHVEVPSPIAFNTTGIVNITIEADNVIGSKQKTLNITKVNGEANAKVDVAANFTLYTLPELVERNVVVEEFTGTGCGWCPRGLVGMDNLRQTYGDRFIGIGLHQYNSSDAMYINANAYAKLNFSGAPSCRIDRKAEIDPYYGSSNDIRDDFAAEMAIPALAKVKVSGVLSEDKKKVAAKAEVEALLDNSQFTLEFVVIGDGLKGSGSSWNQTNYYYQYTPAQAGAVDDLALFCKGGKYGKSSVTGWVFNDVALVSSYVGGSNKAPQLGTLAANESNEAEYTLTLPTKTTLKNALQYDQLYIIALLLDKNKQIVNAAKTKVVPFDGVVGVETAKTSANSVETYFTVDGKRLAAPAKGMNVVRMSDGTIRKIIVR